MRGNSTFQAVLASIILLAVTAPPAYAVDSSGCGGSGQMAVVAGHENAALDVPAVQAAVDAGGKVLLKGTFDFGVTGRVLLKKDVTICGEADDSGVLLPPSAAVSGPSILHIRVCRRTKPARRSRSSTSILLTPGAQPSILATRAARPCVTT